MLGVVAFVFAVVCKRMQKLLGVVASLLAVVCKRMQQLPIMLGPAVHDGKDTTHKTLKTMCNARAWPQQCLKELGKRIQHCYACTSAITERKKCWELLAEKFNRFQTLRNNSQQYATTCNSVRKRTHAQHHGHLTISLKLLANNVASVFMLPYINKSKESGTLIANEFFSSFLGN